jgi:gluconokinase
VTGAQHIVVMGVSGCGKTTIAERIAASLVWPFDEGDRHHSKENIDKMRGGAPLTDADRAPWLATLAGIIARHDRAGASSILSCSALKRDYRNTLRSGAERVRFIHLHGARSILEGRLGARQGHFFPRGLLDTQLATLQALAEDEDGIVIDIALAVDAQVDRALGWIRTGG